MCAERAHNACVLLGPLDPLARLGMARLLAEGGMRVVEESTPAQIPGVVERVLPDAVVMPLEGNSGEVERSIRLAAPGAKLIFWARDESEMQVFDPGSPEPRRVGSGLPEALVAELRRAPEGRGDRDGA